MFHNSLKQEIMSTTENPLKITVMHNGPYTVEGTFTLVDKDGKETQETGTIHLCRCGHSHHKPFCDGTHAKIHFDDTAE